MEDVAILLQIYAVLHKHDVSLLKEVQEGAVNLLMPLPELCNRLLLLLAHHVIIYLEIGNLQREAWPVLRSATIAHCRFF